jgi:hypothetical protein
MNRLADVFAPSMPAERLGMLRILIGAYGVVYLFARIGAIVGSTHYPAAQFKPVGLSVVLDQPLAPWMVVAGLIVAIVTGVAFTVGWRFRVSGPLFAFSFLWVLCYRNSWGMPFHTENLLVLHAIVLAAGPSAEAWSMDARGTVLPEPARRYGWVIVLMCWVTALTYFVAGWAKLAHSGFGWVTSDTLRNFIAYDNIRKAELGAGYSTLGTWMVAHAWVFPPLAAVSLSVELTAPLSVLHRKFGMVWCLAAWGFHVGVLALMYILFHYPILGFAYVAYFPVERLGRWVYARVPKRASQ